jgi:hypothetical protein
MNARERLEDALRAAGKHVSGNKAQCPAHDDRNPSLSIGDRRDGKGIVLKCHGGCTHVDVLAALGLSERDLFDDDAMRDVYNPKRDYRYPGGRVNHRNGLGPNGSKKMWQENSQDHSLYLSDDLGHPDAVVYVCEGEKAAEMIRNIGGIAVATGGAERSVDWSPLEDRHVVLIADRDKAGRKWADRAIEELRPIAKSVKVVQAAVNIAKADAVDHIAAGLTLDELAPVDPLDRVVLTTLADVEPERVSWLWPGRIPVGKLVTLDGDPGLGKSTLAIAIASPVTTGGTWPDGSVCAYPGDVLLMSAEDGLADAVRPRADAAGADVTKVHAVDGVPIDAEGTLRPPTLADIAALEQAITRTGARLLVIDVVMAYLPDGTDSHKDQDIRQVLSRLATLADRTGCTVLLIRHLNKARGGDPLYRGGGSIGIVGAARAGLLVAPDPDDTERRVLASVESNLGPTPESLAYRLVGDGEYGVARVQWEGQTAHTARTLLAEPSDDDGAKTEAEHWLQDYLAEQCEVPSKTVKADAAKVGIRERTLQRAVSSLGVTVESRGFPRVTWWLLPSRDSDDNPPLGLRILARLARLAMTCINRMSRLGQIRSRANSLRRARLRTPCAARCAKRNFWRPRLSSAASVKAATSPPNATTNPTTTKGSHDHPN